MKKAICFIFDSNYVGQGKYAIESARKHNPDHTTILLIENTSDYKLADIQLSPSDIGLPEKNWLTIGRVAIVEYALKHLGFDTAIFVDGDTYSYNSYQELQEAAENSSILVIPHLTKPLPNDDKFPQNRVISLSGNYNTGVWAASKSGLDFIGWWKEQTALFPITRPDAGLVNEQGWLRFAGDFDDNTKIFRHPGYNVAYWNIKQRTLSKIDNTWLIDNKPLAIVHFSGLKKDIDPSQMSIFQNRYWLDSNDLAHNIYSSYHKLIWGQ
jgi:hypothetical protein